MPKQYLIDEDGIEAMLRQLVEEIDYDIFKEIYYYVSEDAEDSQEVLRNLVLSHLKPFDGVR